MAGPYRGQGQATTRTIGAAGGPAAAAGAGADDRPTGRLRSPRGSNELQQHDSPTDTLGFPLGPHEAHWAAGLRPHTHARGPGLPACLDLLTEPFHMASCSVAGAGGGCGCGGGGKELPIHDASSSVLHSSQLPSSNYLVHYPHLYGSSDDTMIGYGVMVGGTAVVGVDPRGLAGATAPPGPASATDELEASQTGGGALRQAMDSAPLPPPRRAPLADAAALRPAAAGPSGKGAPYTGGGGGGGGGMGFQEGGESHAAASGTPVAAPAAAPASARAEPQGEGAGASSGAVCLPGGGADRAEGRGQVVYGGKGGGTAVARSAGEAGAGAGVGGGNRGAGPAAMPVTRMPRNSG